MLKKVQQADIDLDPTAKGEHLEEVMVDSSPVPESTLPRQRGFSLIEVLVVMALATILVLAGVPSLQLWRVKSRMTGDMQQITGAVITARMQALRRGVQTVLELDPSASHQVRYGDDDDGNEQLETGDVQGQLRLNESITMSVPSCYSLGSSSTKGILFAPDGRVTSDAAGNGAGACQVELTDPAGNRVRLLLNSGSGTIARQMWTGSTWSDELRYWKR